MTNKDGYLRLPQGLIDNNPCPEELVVFGVSPKTLDRDSLLAALVAVCEESRRNQRMHQQNREMQNLFAKQFGD